MNSIFTRRSIREYDSCPVEQEKLERILRAGMQTPSAMNQGALGIFSSQKSGDDPKNRRIDSLRKTCRPSAGGIGPSGQSSNRRGEKSFLGTGSVSQRTEYPVASYRRGPRRMLDGHLSG